MPKTDARLAALAVALALAAAPARALDRFEIQVYQADINEPGQVGLEVHTNFTGSGARDPAFPGEIPPDRTARLTLEPAIGVTSWLELGGYFQTFLAPGNAVRYGGVKLRAKLVAPPVLGDHFFLGVNFELARLAPGVEAQPWANEIRPFVGYDDGLFLVDLNPIVTWDLEGPDTLRPAFEPALKLAVNTQRGFAIGIEWYAELGFFDAITPLRDQAHYAFGVVDLVPPRGRAASPWEVNLAVGAGIGHAADQQLIVKTIVGRSF